MRRLSTAVAITDPLVKYQSLVAAGVCSPCPAQHRLARHLRKIYLDVKDYSPQVDYLQRLRQVSRLTDRRRPEAAEEEEKRGQGDGSSSLALPRHAIWRNPLFKHLLPSREAREARESLALTRALTDHQTAMEMDSPRGLFLSGEVGTGKSMLLRLLADGLPTSKKKQWHFHTFMLHTFAQLDAHRAASRSQESEYSLLWMAKKLVGESPILFLDEFQLPDRAAGKILSHLFIAFFQLGGVLVASSNRMPEELEKASGAAYTQTSRGLVGRMLGLADSKGQGNSDFASFLDVLKARCEFWQMEVTHDWRRREDATATEKAIDTGKTPHHYYLGDDAGDCGFGQRIREAVSWDPPDEIPWGPSQVIVYGRKVLTPRHYRGFVLWDFADLVASFGPADYITMASSYHTFIIDHVPVLTVLSKNEARRFITLLDALYESRCKLIIRAEASPDELFFPDSPSSTHDASSPHDATYSETVAEVYQDSTAPFRPNVSYYDTDASTSRYDPDRDSDFGSSAGKERVKSVDFRDAGAFTGEDERFAYRRAASRLWELCSARWHARDGDWWRPLPLEARHWEGGSASRPPDPKSARGTSRSLSGETMGESVPVDELAGLSKWRVDDLKRRTE